MKTEPTFRRDEQPEHDALKNEVADLLLGPDSPVESQGAFKRAREEYAGLKKNEAELAELAEGVSAVVSGIARAERGLAETQKSLATESLTLAAFAGELGKAMFAGLQAGEIEDQPCFAERKELQSRIDALRQQRSRLVAVKDAGIIEKAKSMAQQLKLTGPIKVAEFKIGATDLAVGESILKSKEDLEIRCSHTEEVLTAIANQRKQVAAAKDALKQAESGLTEQTLSAAEALGRSAVQNATSLQSELKEIKAEQQKITNAVSDLRNAVVTKALDYEWLRENAELGSKLERLSVQRKALLPTKLIVRAERQSEEGPVSDQLQSNANAVGFWSLLFSPIFGAWLHAINWRELGEPGKAKQSWVWVFGGGFVLVAVCFLNWTNLLPHAMLYTKYFNMLTVAWWIHSGQKQYKFVQATWPDYQKKSWTRPLLFAGLMTIWVFGLSLAIGFDQYTALERKRFELIQTKAVELVNESIPEQEKGTYLCTHVFIGNEATAGTFNAVAYYDDGDVLDIVIRSDGQEIQIGPAEPPAQAE